MYFNFRVVLISTFGELSISVTKRPSIQSKFIIDVHWDGNEMSPFFYYFSFFCQDGKLFYFFNDASFIRLIHSFYCYYHLFFPHLLVWKCYHFRFVSLFTKNDSRTKPCRFLSHSPSVFLIQWVCNVNLLEKTIETYIKIIYIYFILEIVFVCMCAWVRRSKGGNVKV